MAARYTHIKTIIWDLDGTLVDSFGVFTGALAEVLPKYGRAVPSDAEILANYHGSLEEAVGNVLDNPDPEELAAIIQDFLTVQNTQYAVIEGHLFKDAEDLVRRAHAAGIRQIIVTNRDHVGRLNASPRSIVANSELQHYIDLVICGDDSEHRKPKPDVLGDFKDIYVPHETLVIGDQFVDAQFAHNLGTAAVLVNRSGEPPHHMERLGHDWQSHVEIVKSLGSVQF